MVFKLKKGPNSTYTSCRKDSSQNNRKKHMSKIQTLHTSMMCFATNCLSSISLEAGTRTPLGNSVIKSVTFNTLFRRSYNLKIVILVTNVIASLITTVMMTLGDRYGIPYLYVPWLVNTIKGIAFCEGPALFSLAHMLLPNIAFPAGTFVVTTLLLYVEELCIWNDVFASFQQCWSDYYREKRYVVNVNKRKFSDMRMKKLPYHDNMGKDINIGLKNFQEDKRSIGLERKSSSQSTVTSTVRSIKSAIIGKHNIHRNRFADVTG